MGTTIDVRVIEHAIEARKAIDDVIGTALSRTLDLWAEKVLDTYSTDVPYAAFGALSIHDVHVLQSVMPAGTTLEDFKQELTDVLTLWWGRRHGTETPITWEIVEWDTQMTGADLWISVIPRTTHSI